MIYTSYFLQIFSRMRWTRMVDYIFTQFLFFILFLYTFCLFLLSPHCDFTVSWKLYKIYGICSKINIRKNEKGCSRRLEFFSLISAICGQVYEHPAVRPQPGEAAAHGWWGGLGLHQRQLRSRLQLQAGVHRYSGQSTQNIQHCFIWRPSDSTVWEDACCFFQYSVSFVKRSIEGFSIFSLFPNSVANLPYLKAKPCSGIRILPFSSVAFNVPKIQVYFSQFFCCYLTVGIFT